MSNNNKSQIAHLVRPNILALSPYSCARDEFKGEASAWLDANESAYNTPRNRYPDPLNLPLKQRFIEANGYTGISPENLFMGVGSDECIDALYRTFCTPGKDNAVAIAPSYGMYSVCAAVNDAEFREVSLQPETFELDEDALIKACDKHTKLMWICSPNNPTGNSFSPEAITRLYNRFDGILVVDEAYIHFSSRPSLVSLISTMPRLVVLQTLSKAWASAAVRLGIAIADSEIISLFNKIKYPYNINALTTEYAYEHLGKSDELHSQVSTALALRNKLADNLTRFKFVTKVYDSDANFLLVKVADANRLYQYLSDNGVVVRNRNNVLLCKNCLRITVGSESELSTLINTLERYEQ